MSYENPVTTVEGFKHELLKELAENLGFCNRDGSVHLPYDFTWKRKTSIKPWYDPEDEYKCNRYPCSHTVSSDQIIQGRAIYRILSNNFEEIDKLDDNYRAFITHKYSGKRIVRISNTKNPEYRSSKDSENKN